MKNFIIFSAIFFFFSCGLYAQTPDSLKNEDDKKGFFKSVKIRKSFESLDAKKDPAVISFTHPVDGKSSYLIDAGLGFDVFNKKNNPISFNTEYHRNTLVSKEVNNFQIGLRKEWVKTKIVTVENGKKRSFYFDVNAKYSTNPLTKSKGGVLTGQISEIYNAIRTRDGKPKFWNPNKPIHTNLLSIYYTPILGFEYQNTVKSDSADLKGSVLRGIAELNLSISPLAKDKISGNGFEVFANYTFRQNVINTTNVSEKYSTNLSTGINIRLTKDEKAKLSLSYNRGSNPVEQLAFQEYYLIALKIKL